MAAGNLAASVQFLNSVAGFSLKIFELLSKAKIISDKKFRTSSLSETLKFSLFCQFPRSSASQTKMVEPYLFPGVLRILVLGPGPDRLEQMLL
jgi:hypothetical protein